MNNQTYRITLNAAALLPLAQGKLECVNLINWYRHLASDEDGQTYVMTTRLCGWTGR